MQYEQYIASLLLWYTQNIYIYNILNLTLMSWNDIVLITI